MLNRNKLFNTRYLNSCCIILSTLLLMIMYYSCCIQATGHLLYLLKKNFHSERTLSCLIILVPFLFHFFIVNLWSGWINMQCGLCCYRRGCRPNWILFFARCVFPCYYMFSFHCCCMLFQKIFYFEKVLLKYFKYLVSKLQSKTLAPFPIQ